MKSSFIAASLMALSATAGAEPAAQTHQIEVSIEVNATEFSARNYGTDQQVLLFRSAEHGPVLARSLPPAAQLSYSFPRHALAGVQLEIITVRDQALVNSGSIPLDAAFGAGAETIWVQSTQDGHRVWFEQRGLFDLHRPDNTFVPPPVLDRGPELMNFRELVPFSATSKTHVPVVPPRDKPEYGPPELEDEPLPPV